MALNKDILGASIFAVRKKFSAIPMPALIAQYGTLENVQLQMAIQEAAVIILHFQTAGEVKTAGTALAQIGTIS